MCMSIRLVKTNVDHVQSIVICFIAPSVYPLWQRGAVIHVNAREGMHHVHCCFLVSSPRDQWSPYFSTFAVAAARMVANVSCWSPLFGEAVKKL